MSPSDLAPDCFRTQTTSASPAKKTPSGLSSLSGTASYPPAGLAEIAVFERLLHARWNLHRERSEAALVEKLGGADPLNDENEAKSLDRLQRFNTKFERAFYRAMAELRTLQTERVYRMEMNKEIKPGFVAPLLCDTNQVIKRSQSAVRTAQKQVVQPIQNAFLAEQQRLLSEIARDLEASEHTVRRPRTSAA